MGFTYEKRKSAENVFRVETVMRQAYTQERGGQYVYEQLRRQGLGYKKQDMLEDYRRFQAIDTALTPETKERAETWYDKVYEPFRKANGYNSDQASKALKMIREGTINTVAEAQKSREYLELYEASF